MKPTRAANQLTKVWRSICPDGNPYPVDCRMLAEALNIIVHGEEFEDGFEAQLRIRGKKSVIIYNENIREEGRKNFTICHEIGHHSCHRGRDEFLCTSNDLNDMAPHPENIEQEANLFAATLLMPVDDFRSQIKGSSNTISTLSKLADERYKTTLTATCLRLIEISPKSQLGMVIISGKKVKNWTMSDEMRWTGFGFKKGHVVPDAGLFHNQSGEAVESDVWLNKKNAPKWDLIQSSVHMPYYDQTLVLLQAERAYEYEKFEESDPTPPSMPSFKK